MCNNLCDVGVGHASDNVHKQYALLRRAETEYVMKDIIMHGEHLTC